jgi:hypothetical protein
MFKNDIAGDDVPGFGNGTACYTCHSQFGQHAQLFVKFRADGSYIADATGQQDPQLAPGESDRGLFTSHLDDPQDSSRESSDMFGYKVSNLSEAAKILSESDEFIDCAVRNTIQYFLRMDKTAVDQINSKVILGIRKTILRQSNNPTIDQIFVKTFSHPNVVLSVLGNGGSE